MTDRRRATPIGRCGVIAREILRDEGETRVVAAFARCCYLACPRGIVCIGEPSIGAGPINVDVVLPDGLSWLSLGIGVDDEGSTLGGRTTLGDSLVVDAASGVTWAPPPPPPFDAGRATVGLRALRARARAILPPGGLSRLVLGARGEPYSDPLLRAASGPIAKLEASLPGLLAGGSWGRDALRAATLLLGLGPGFTPSGDDVLGGLMLALTAGGRLTLRDALWQALEPELGALTVPASAMHLSAAADGMASEPVHDLVAALLIGDEAPIARRLDAVAMIGHTSGWDILAGLVMGLDALTRAGREFDA